MIGCLNKLKALLPTETKSKEIEEVEQRVREMMGLLDTVLTNKPSVEENK